MRSVSSLTLVRLKQMIVGLGLPLNMATIILGCIFSVLLSDFMARGPISIPTPPIVALTEFFHADTGTNVYPLPVSWYLYLCDDGICVLVCILCYDLSQKLSAPKVGLFYLRF